MKPDMILQVLSNAELLFTNKTLVGSLTIVNVHVICKLVLGEELHGTNFAVKKHDGTALFLCVLLKVNLKTFSLCESLETEVASVKGSVCFHRLHCRKKCRIKLIELNLHMWPPLVISDYFLKVTIYVKHQNCSSSWSLIVGNSHKLTSHKWPWPLFGVRVL